MSDRRTDMWGDPVTSASDALVEFRGWFYPEAVTATWRTPDRTVEVAGLCDSQLGPQLTELRVLGLGLGWEDLLVPALDLLRRVFADLALPARGREGTMSDAPTRPLPRITPNREAAWNRLDEVADAARGAEGSAAVAVADRMGVSVGYARNLMALARKRGLL